MSSFTATVSEMSNKCNRLNKKMEPPYPELKLGGDQECCDVLVTIYWCEITKHPRTLSDQKAPHPLSCVENIPTRCTAFHLHRPEDINICSSTRKFTVVPWQGEAKRLGLL